MNRHSKYLGYLFILAFIAKAFAAGGQLDPILIVLLMLGFKLLFSHSHNTTEKSDVSSSSLPKFL